MTDADKVMNPQHFGNDPTCRQASIDTCFCWMLINPEIRIWIPGHCRLRLNALAEVCVIWAQSSFESRCGHDVIGNCVGEELEVSDVDGSWSEWTSWTECSALCGGGTRSRHRRCDSPAASGTGRECVGHSYQLADCHTHSCQVCRVGCAVALSVSV